MAKKYRRMPFSRQQLMDGHHADLSQVYKRLPVNLPKMPTKYRLPKLSGEYWYIACKLNGRMVLLGPYDTENEAYEIGSSKLNTAYEVIPMNTKDRSEATRRLRHRILNETSDLGRSLRRMKHRV